MNSTNTTNVVNILRTWFSQFGLPKQIVTDNGPQFVSTEFDHFSRQNGINHITSFAYHQQSNGAAERCVQTLKKALKSNKVNPNEIQKKLDNFLLAYRATPRAITGLTPSELIIGRRINTRIELIKPVK